MLATLVLLAQSIAPSAPIAPSTTDELLALTKALGSASSYRVATTAKTTRARARTTDTDPTTTPDVREDGAWTIDYEAGKPLHFVSLTREFFRSDTQFVVPHPRSGKWFAVDRVKGDLSQAPRGHGEIAKMLDQANAIVLPHEWRDDFSASLADVRCDTVDGGRNFTARLTEETAKKWCAPFSVVIERARPQREEAAGGAAASSGAASDRAVGAKPTATLAFVVVDGAIESIRAELTLPIEGSRGANLVTQTFRFSAVGSAKVELPPDVAAVLKLK